MAPILWAFVIICAFKCAHSKQESLRESSAASLYKEALIRLDMEDLENVTSQMINFDKWEELHVHSSLDNCSDIVQTTGIGCMLCGNSSMTIKSTNSFVGINGTHDLSEGLSASFWINRPSSTNSCTALVISTSVANDVDDYVNFTVKRRNGIDDDEYSLAYMDVTRGPLNITTNKTWDWNMFSFTADPQKDAITVYINGELAANLSNCSLEWTTQTFVELSINGRNSHNETGCSSLSVDEVSLWSRVLKESEFIALRIGSRLEMYHAEIKSGSLEDASESFNRVKEQVGLSNPETGDDVNAIVNILETVESRNMLNHQNLNASTRKKNREIYIFLTGVIFRVASQNQEIANLIDATNMIGDLEEVLAEVYFHGSVTQETIDVPELYLSMDTFDQQDSQPGCVNTPGSQFCIPAEIFDKGKVQQAIVILFNRTVASLIPKGSESSVLTEKAFSEIASLQISVNTKKTFADPVNITFSVTAKELEKERSKMMEPSCRYLELKTSKWLTDGVKTIITPDVYGRVDIICRSEHLTNFAILMSPTKLVHNETLSALSYILLTMSIISLFISLVVLMCLREIGKSQRVQILKQFIVALLISQLLFVFTTDLLVPVSMHLCVLSTVLSHYFWLATFTWMLVQGIQLYTKIKRLVGTNIKQLFYVLFAWGFPLPIALVPLTVYSSRYIEQAKTNCWIPPTLIWFLAIPAILIFSINVGVTVMVMRAFLTVKVNKDKSDAEKFKSSMRAVVVMVPVLGLTWSFGFLLLIDTNLLFQYLFVILNALQGVFVFFFHLVMNEDVRSAVLRRRNKVAASAENTIFTKLPARHKSNDNSTGATMDTKAPVPPDSASM